jgi:glutaredoxin
MARITFYTRAGCHLCDEALAALGRVRERHPFDLDVVDLDAGAAADKRAAYDWEVPVTELDGRKIMKYRVDEARLLRLLALAGSGGVG